MATLTSEPFGEVAGEGAATLYTLTDRHGFVLSVTDFGAAIVRFVVPAERGAVDVALGFDCAEDYDAGGKPGRPYFGCVVGRVANRIGGAKFSLGGEDYTVPANDGANALHGGPKGFDRRLWRKVDDGSDKSGQHITFELVSEDGDMGFPGEVVARVTYTLEGNGRLRTQMEATTTKETPLSLAQHCYWNLAGHDAGTTVDAHVLEISSNGYTASNSELIPTAEIVDVTGTPFDFRLGVALGSRVEEAGGYDHNFVLSRNRCRRGEDVKRCARLSCVSTGVAFELCTNAPGVQCYSGNFLDGVTGKHGAVYHKRGGVALETQGWPNAVNELSFPSVILRPGETYAHTMLHAFTCEAAAE